MENITYKIFIPTRSRYNIGELKTVQMFTPMQCKANITLVVEPQELDAYKQNYSNCSFLVLPEGDKGITYSRNFIKNYCLVNNIKQYWQIDDDITHLYTRTDTKLFRAEATDVLQKCGDILKNANVAIGSLDFRQFAWAANKPIVYNSYCCNVVYMDSDKLANIWYSENTKEDYDIIIAAITNNLTVARLTEYAYSTPAIGSNKGGLKDIFYDLHLDEQCVQGLIDKWGEYICQPLIRPNGRKDVKINWKNINKQQPPTLF